MNNFNHNHNVLTNNTGIKNIAKGSLLAAALVFGMSDANAYDLQSDTIYANADGGIYKIELNGAASSATRVADTNESLSTMGDIAFDGSTIYGANLHWQLLKLEPDSDVTEAINDASSFSLQFNGVEARNGVLYGAETRSLVILDQETAAPSSLGPGSGGYGLGAGELVTDLAFAEDGTLYASVTFSGISYSYLGTISLDTGELMLLGNTGVENITALTVKQGVIYAMDKTGDLYTLNEVSGFASNIATAVLPGVNGMDTSPVMLTAGAGTAAGGDESAGAMSALLFLFAPFVVLMRRFR